MMKTTATTAMAARRLAILLLVAGGAGFAGLAGPAAAQSTIEVQPLEPLNPDDGQGGDGVTVRPLQPLDEAEEGGFVRLPAPETSDDPGDLFTEGFDENAFGESAGESEGEQAATPAPLAGPSDEITEDGLWAPEALGAPSGTRDQGESVGENVREGEGEQAAVPAPPAGPSDEITEDGLWAPEAQDAPTGQSDSAWMEPSGAVSGSGTEGEGTAALLEEEAGDGNPRFLVAPPTGNGLFGPNRPRPLPQTATVPAGGAEIRELDKMTGATRTVTMQAGEERQVGRLRVRLEGCHMPQEGGAQGTRAFLRVWDPLHQDDAPVFSGWMFAESPALSALDHPRYDLWVLGCTTTEAAGAGEGDGGEG